MKPLDSFDDDDDDNNNVYEIWKIKKITSFTNKTLSHDILSCGANKGLSHAAW